MDNYPLLTLKCLYLGGASPLDYGDNSQFFSWGVCIFHASYSAWNLTPRKPLVLHKAYNILWIRVRRRSKEQPVTPNIMSSLLENVQLLPETDGIQNFSQHAKILKTGPSPAKFC